MLANLKEFFKLNKKSILLFLIITLLCLFSFGVGMLTQFYIQKPNLEIEKGNSL
jgi:predicted negative regulator of RcsB-dependent stress response